MFQRTEDSQNEELRRQYEAAASNARKLRAEANAKRDKLTADGINLLDPANASAFKELETMYRDADTASESASEMRGKLELLTTGGRAFFGAAGQISQDVGDAFVSYLREQNAYSSNTGGAQLPSMLRSYLSAPVMRAAIDGGGTMHQLGDSIIARIPQRKLSILDLIPGQGVASLGGLSLDYIRQTVRTSAAAVVPALETKPTSTLTVELASTTLYTVASISDQIPRQLMSNMAELQPFVSQEIAGMVKEKCEDLALSGSGTGEPAGITITSGTLTQPLGGDTRLGALRKAITQLALINVIPDAICMNPTDSQKIDLETDADGQYLTAGPLGNGLQQVWRTRVVESNGVTEGTVIVGNFALGAKQWNGTSRLVWSEAVGSDFAQNALRFLAEEGFGFAVIRPTNFCVVTGF